MCDGTYPSFFDIICMDEKNKEIIVLTEKEHIRQRSHIYTGPVKPIEEKVPIIVSKKLTVETRVISVALYKIFNEILDNALDECKRMKGKMKLITVSIESKKNRASVKDTGNGFYKGASKNKISGKSNIETAVSMLRSGSNFNNENNNESLIGNNGVGSALCNCLSDEFKIVTVNDSHYYEQTWIDFESVGPNVRKKESSDKMGTEISFIPLKSLFGSSKWDKEIITSALCLKKRLIKKDPITKNLELEFYWDGVKIELDPDCFPPDAFSIETAIGEIIIWEKYENSGSISFVNSAMCTGIHQKILNDFINLKLEDTLGHHFYDTYMSIGLPPKLVSFRDQNKTRFDTPRDEVEGTISRNVLEKMGKFFSSPLYKSIKKQVDDRKRESELKKIRKDKKTVRIKNSNKYFPPASSKPENLFIVEGLCIDENERINVWRDGELMNIPLRDVFIGDEIITHSNRIREIVNKQRKLKECVSIRLKDGTVIKQPKTHQYYIFNSITKEFSFKRIDEIDIKTDNLVRSNLGNFIGTLEVINIYRDDTNLDYPNQIFLEDGSFYQFSDSHKYCVYSELDKSFSMKIGREIKIGELFGLFDAEGYIY